MIPLSFKGKRALVGGATRGIGRAIAREFAELGASVVLLGRNENALAQAVKEMPTPEGQSHSYVCADFGDPETLRTKVQEELKRSGPVQILVNNTGGPTPGQIIEASASAFTQAFAAHLLCNHYLAQSVIPGMRENGSGRIINIVSTSVREPLAGLGVSNTTRGAVASWAKTLAGEVGRFGITVNNILPGPTETDRLRAIFERKAQEHGSTPEAEREAMRKMLPLARLGKPEEIAYAACFLASEAAAFITGVSLAVDGGRMASI